MRYDWRDPSGGLWRINTENRSVTRVLTPEEQEHPEGVWHEIMDQCQTMGFMPGSEPVTEFVFHRQPGCGETVYRRITRMARGKAPEHRLEDAAYNLNRNPERAESAAQWVIIVAIVALVFSCLLVALTR